MPANKYALLRYRIIDRCLCSTSRPFPSKEDLRQACEDSLYGSEGIHISISTIEKDLWAMRNESDLGYYAPIEYHKANRGYFYEDEDYTIQDISLSDNELDAIQLAANTLNQFRDIPIFAEYQQAIDKILNRLTINPQAEDEKRIIQFESSPSARGQEYLSPLFSGIQNKQKIQIKYQKFSGTQSKDYSIHPHLLKEYRNRWYLIAFEPLRNDYLTFGLDRILELTVLADHFVMNPDFDSDRFFLYSVGITERNSSPQRVVLQFSKTQGQYLLSQPLHHSQKLVGDDTGQITLEYFILITHELIQFILGLGQEVIVLNPRDLKDQIIHSIEATVRHYK